MEAKNMARPESARSRHGIFGIIGAPLRETGTPVITRPDVKPAVSPEPGKKPKTPKKPLIQRLAGNLALRVILAGTAIAGTGYGIYQEVPAVHRAVDNLTGADTTPLTFDNQKDAGKITNNNSIGIPLDELKQETYLEPERKIHIGIFLDVPQDTSISYIKSLPNIGYVDDKGKNPYDQYSAQEIKNTIAFTDIPIGTVVRAPFKGKASRPMRIVDTKSPDVYLSLNLIFQDEEGKWYGLLFSGAKNVKMIAEVPKLDPRSSVDRLNEWLDVDVGDELFSIQSEELVGSPYPGGFPSQLSLEVLYGPNGFGKDPWIPINIDFVTRGGKIVHGE